MDSRELFEQTRESVREMERQGRLLRKLEAREGLHGAGFEAIRSSGISDPMRATDDRIDHEARIRRSMEDCERQLDYACAILYGEDYSGRTGGLYVLADHELADILCFYYCQALTWDEVSDMVGYARTPCISKAHQALDLIDAYGFERCIQGLGMAEG